MPKTIPAGLNPVLILSTLQRRQCDKSELMRLHVKAIQFESLLNDLTGASLTLENLAGDIQEGKVSGYDEPGTVYQYAQSAHQIKKYLTEYLDQLVPVLLQKAKEVRS